MTAVTSCYNQLIAIGQVYRYTLTATSWLLPFLDPLNPEDEDFSTAHWVSARLGGNQSSILGRQRIKDYVYETLAFDTKHNILYELGGITDANSEQQAQAMGGSTPVLYSDTLTGEAIRESVYLPVNSAWTLQQALYNGSLLQRQSQDDKESTKFKFDSVLRVYSVAAKDITLMQEISSQRDEGS